MRLFLFLVLCLILSNSKAFSVESNSVDQRDCTQKLKERDLDKIKSKIVYTTQVNGTIPINRIESLYKLVFEYKSDREVLRIVLASIHYRQIEMGKSVSSLEKIRTMTYYFLREGLAFDESLTSDKPNEVKNFINFIKLLKDEAVMIESSDDEIKALDAILARARDLIKPPSPPKPEETTAKDQEQANDNQMQAPTGEVPPQVGQGGNSKYPALPPGILKLLIEADSARTGDGVEVDWDAYQNKMESVLFKLSRLQDSPEFPALKIAEIQLRTDYWIYLANSRNWSRADDHLRVLVSEACYKVFRKIVHNYLISDDEIMTTLNNFVDYQKPDDKALLKIFVNLLKEWIAGSSSARNDRVLEVNSLKDILEDLIKEKR